MCFMFHQIIEDRNHKSGRFSCSRLRNSKHIFAFHDRLDGFELNVGGAFETQISELLLDQIMYRVFFKTHISNFSKGRVFLVKCTRLSEKKAQIGKAVDVSYAKHFKIVQHEHYAVLSIMQPETGKVEREYALVKKADKSFAPAGMDQIEVPVKRMAVLSTTHIGMLDAIDALDCVKGATDKNFIANKKVLQGIEKGEIVGFSDETSIVPEQLLENEISLVVYSGFGKGFPNEEKLKQLDVLVMANYDWREEHPLGKAEWIKVFGFLKRETGDG